MSATSDRRGGLRRPASGAPGFADLPAPPLFRIADSAPTVTLVLTPSASIDLLFAGGAPEPGSANAATVVARDAAGADLGAVVFARGATVTVSPSVTWPSGPLTIEVHAGLTSLDGTALAVPVALPFTVVP